MLRYTMVSIMKINACSVITSRWNAAQPKCISWPPRKARPPISSISASSSHNVALVDNLSFRFSHNVATIASVAAIQNQAGMWSPNTELSPAANQAEPAVKISAINMKINSPA